MQENNFIDGGMRCGLTLTELRTIARKREMQGWSTATRQELERVIFCRKQSPHKIAKVETKLHKKNPKIKKLTKRQLVTPQVKYPQQSKIQVQEPKSQSQPQVQQAKPQPQSQVQQAKPQSQVQQAKPQSQSQVQQAKPQSQVQQPQSKVQQAKPQSQVQQAKSQVQQSKLQKQVGGKIFF